MSSPKVGSPGLGGSDLFRLVSHEDDPEIEFGGRGMLLFKVFLSCDYACSSKSIFT